MKKLSKLLIVLVVLLLCVFCSVACNGEEGHKFCEWYALSSATCTEDGVMCRDCINCNYSEMQSVTANGHTIEQVEAKSPTHLEVGYEAYEYCTNCDYTTRVDIPMIEHEFAVEVTAPTCTEEGYTTYTCECGHSKTDDYVDANGHNYEIETTPVTCEEDGLSVYTCACGETYEEVLVATGHKASGWIMDEEPTSETEGSMHKECEYCKTILEESTVSPID